MQLFYALFCRRYNTEQKFYILVKSICVFNNLSTAFDIIHSENMGKLFQIAYVI